MERATLIAKPAKDFELLDSGEGEKLERYGNVILARPDPQALWEKGLSAEEWKKAQGQYVRGSREGEWVTHGSGLPKDWKVEFGGLSFLIRPTSFKHTGLFPEQFSNWEWVRERLSGDFSEPPTILNLFAYTGGATLVAAQAGAHVTHVDASKTAVAWAKENATLSDLSEAPIRWLIEDVLVFVKREIKRGKHYDGIIMDPPAFGHGPKDELWKIEEDFIELVRLCRELLSDNPLFFLMSGYAAGYSSLAFAYNLESLQKKYGGSITFGDLTIEESENKRLLPCGIFARWSR
jgi:23S rRNA (cytosine1962-C5)-methyltransferase